ncbi:hypothetical protein U1Q18_032991 [Sarracenia purpurea var. burkii]
MVSDRVFPLDGFIFSGKIRSGAEKITLIRMLGSDWKYLSIVATVPMDSPNKKVVGHEDRSALMGRSNGRNNHVRILLFRASSDDEGLIGVAMDAVPAKRLGKEPIKSETEISFKDGDSWGRP